jgi:DNA-binding beta-propeller fold protein YncE
MAATSEAASGTAPGAIAASPNGKRLFLTDAAGHTVTELSARTLKRLRTIEVDGAPIDVAVARGGRTALVLTASYDRPGLAVVDLARGAVAKRLDVGEDPYALALAPAGGKAFVSGGGTKGTLTAVDLRSHAAGPAIPVGAHPRGVAVVPGGGRALVALNGAAGLAVVDLVHGRRTRTIRTPPFPYRVAISPNGKRALVTHAGARTTLVSLVDLARGKVLRRIHVGRDPYAVAFAPGDRTAVVSDYGGHAVTLVNLKSGRHRTLQVGNRPRGLAIVGRTAYVVNEFEGSVSAVRLPRFRPPRKAKRAN